ncbi:hypothetical protein [Amycolatopsis eburnea]|uniref:Uncharacterized protein n=1 Tax=Amycolatopsis eburnea TaxID=2267691 RepID=A0A427TJY8_9PSEU|nr:hypothetical protein [Amycolatopsis eburnea]RSD23922.1 hypothetical protein EIY87_06010 [Amycolatopsis eburnea]
MALTVTFSGKTPVSTGATSYYQVWTYTVQASSLGELAGNQRIALALPAAVDVQDPRRYPDVGALGGAFLEKDAAGSRQYAGKVVGLPGTTQTISFVAPAAQADRELFLVGASGAGRPWTVLPFAAGGPVANSQALPAPSAAVRVGTGRPLAEFTGALPYASESFGLIQPLLGWRSQRTVARFAEALRRADDAVLAGLSQVVTPRARYVPPVIHLEAASAGETLELKTGDAPATAAYHPMIASVLADLIQARIKDKDPRDPATWLPLLSRASLDTILATEVSPVLFSRAATVEPTDEAKRRALVETMAAKESVVAGLLGYLAAQNLVPTLADLFTPPRQGEFDTSQYRGLQRMLDPLESASRAEALNRVSLSPVGIVHLFRQYFFEFDTFLGPPVQHVWLSPGSSLELIESQTRRTLVERVVEEGQELTQSRTGESKVDDEVSTAVKDENERNTKLGFSVSANQRWVWGDANETATMDMSDTQKQAREQTHKQMRQQSERLSTEIKRSFKTTFRTVTETTDTSSRRYVLANSTGKLINYELRRKMRRVGVQVQDLGTQLCWQSFVDDPGAALGLAKLVHLAAPPDAAAVAPANELPMPEDYTEDVTVQFGYPFNGYIRPVGGGGTGFWIADVELTPRDGYEPAKVGEVRWTASTAAVKLKLGRKPEDAPEGTPVPKQPALSVFLYNAHGERNELFAFTVPVTYRATDEKRKQVTDQNKLLAAKRDLELDQKQREAYLKAAQDRVAAASKIQVRDYDVLREEERVVVYRRLLEQLMRIDGRRPTQPELLHKLAELINSMFDVEAMLYFVAPEWWRPRLHEAHPTFAPELDRLGDPRLETPGGGPALDPSLATAVDHIVRDSPTGLDDHTVGWANEGDMSRRDNYFITADSAPARLGSSLGWLLQLDGDHQRNAFLNAPWVKAVVPIRPGKELAALNWLSDPSIEGATGLDDLYQPATDGESTRILAALRAHPWSDPALVTRYRDLTPAGLTIRDVLRYVAVTVLAKHEAGTEVVTEQLEPGVTLNYLRPDMVYEKGFDPLEKGFKAESEQGYEVFDQWVEVLPTDQVAVVEVEYDPKTGQQV